jgi:hypothetical protein
MTAGIKMAGIIDRDFRSDEQLASLTPSPATQLSICHQPILSDFYFPIVVQHAIRGPGSRADFEISRVRLRKPTWQMIFAAGIIQVLCGEHTCVRPALRQY